MHRSIALAAVTVTAIAALTGTAACAEDPCKDLPRPSAEEILTNPDIEAAGRGGVECDFEDGRWQRDVDHKIYRSTRQPTTSSSTTSTTSKKSTPTSTTKKAALR